ncbi:glycosyltransferase family 4 protein, partial [Henriciella sp.]|uniref:glycosyltransferase family 4 protein n=1 Tax=Henriciella sp. TaxID=1968823 RepID=UPI0025C6CFED
YACDWDRFEYGDQAAGPSSFNADEPYFLYVGRYVREKGIDTLAEAYRRYKNNVSAPWRLVCAGAGPLENTLSEVGAENLGFVQPEQLPYFMRNAAAFVLPSRYEPWGVVAQEAAASGLPLLLSDEVGAGVHLLRDGLNGFKHPPGDAKALGDCLSRLHQTKKEKISLMGQHSKSLSQQYTPEHWANTFASGLNILRNNSAVHESKS